MRLEKTEKAFLLIAFVFLLSFFARPMNAIEVSELKPGVNVRFVLPSGKAANCDGTLAKDVAGQLVVTKESTQSCRDGWLAWDGIEPGNYLLTTQTEHMERWEKRFVVANDMLELGDQKLRQGATLKGRVLQAGAPVGGAHILVEGGRRARTTADGLFVIKGLPDTPLQVRVASLAGRGSAQFLGRKQGDEALVVEINQPQGRGLLGFQFSHAVQGEGPVVTDILKSTSAAQHLQRGDRLVSIDGVPVRELTKGGIQQLLKGTIGSIAKLQILREEKPQKVELLRVNTLDLIKP